MFGSRDHRSRTGRRAEQLQRDAVAIAGELRVLRRPLDVEAVTEAAGSCYACRHRDDKEEKKGR